MTFVVREACGFRTASSRGTDPPPARAGSRRTAHNGRGFWFDDVELTVPFGGTTTVNKRKSKYTANPQVKKIRVK